MIKAKKLGDIFNEMEDKVKQMQKEFEASGGMCLHCKKRPADPEAVLNRYHCIECNKETEDILKQLRGPGFHEFRF